FNDPIPCADHTEKAVRMALDMQSKVEDLRAEWPKRGYELDLGIGMSAGYATLGNIGFEGRMDYGAIGNVTNLAARLCSEAKARQILVDRKTRAALEGAFAFEPVGPLTLKGFDKPVPAFAVQRGR